MACLAHETAERRRREATLILLFPDRQASAAITATTAGDTLTIQLLLLCRSFEERAIVAFHHYHRLTINQAAQRAGLSRAKAIDLLESLRQRLALAEQAHKCEMILAKEFS